MIWWHSFSSNILTPKSYPSIVDPTVPEEAKWNQINSNTCKKHWTFHAAKLGSWVAEEDGRYIGMIWHSLFLKTLNDRSLKITSPKGEPVRVLYKVLIPLENIKCVNHSKSERKSSQKYLEIETLDNFDFWFMGFLNYRQTFKYLQLAVSQSYGMRK